ncbi:peptidase M15 [Antarcticibacterium flavum]|uniref:D-alanyl-D-alanine dipeptidase n=1 Tax=Antarcticibacterium flavum TaxID=2058175 RepID=A0A5B7X498_9FLAO|nr:MULTISPECIES: M15 family metallopeptidase [Antarcticibacterium]MCM4158570.1 peptidase M15 [Antarcticibacterium sp. W02-3]QCY70314.1 peptidase M15 [Antarcticibacterium flavum]
MRFSFLLFSILFTINTYGQTTSLPKGFVYVKEVIPDVLEEMRYYSDNNFIGKPIEGYKSNRAILAEPAALALKRVQKELKKGGYCLKIFDAYRPQRAVNEFISWAKQPEDTLKKQLFYPEIPKDELFERGYISSRSGHSRGSTIDLSIIDANTGVEIDMGSPYDFFGSLSHHDTSLITPAQRENRLYLKSIMRKHGFVAYPQEWWHYTFKPEAFPETYFDFVVE